MTNAGISPSNISIQMVENLCVFTGNITGYAVEIKGSKITIDGTGYTLQSQRGGGTALIVRNKNQVTIKNMVIQGFPSAI